MKTFFKDFRSFISKGNVLDLAIALVIGTAFNAIVKSLVNDIIMPLIGLIFKSDMNNLYWVLRGEANYVAGELILSEDAVLMTYGNFLSSIVNFLLIALSIFVAIRFIAKMQDHLDDVKKRINPDKDGIEEESK
jgi:large conductance mechanosensitive channel